jgi:quercetin 2,3-dioxygenase
MIILRKAADRGRSDLGWLDSRHTFSFGDYYDPAHLGFRALRVINDDRVAAGGGFGTHPHRDMEIVSYVLEGALEHKDSLGTGSVIRPGDVQRMSAGTGVRHSEYNHSKSDPVHFLQIWILPANRGMPPSYEQKSFPPGGRRGRLRLVGSHDARDGSVTIHQDVDLYLATLQPGDRVQHPLRPSRHAWVHLIDGAVTLNGTRLDAADGAAVTGETRLELVASAPSDVMLFDLG